MPNPSKTHTESMPEKVMQKDTQCSKIDPKMGPEIDQKTVQTSMQKNIVKNNNL
jgi:hypothetical protein